MEMPKKRYDANPTREIYAISFFFIETILIISLL